MGLFLSFYAISATYGMQYSQNYIIHNCTFSALKNLWINKKKAGTYTYQPYLGNQSFLGSPFVGGKLWGLSLG